MTHLDSGAAVPTEGSLGVPAALSIAGLFILGCRNAGTGAVDQQPSSLADTSAAAAPAAFPEHLAGLRFGITREETRRAGGAAGFEVHLHERELADVGAVSAITCVGLLKPEPMSESAYVEGAQGGTP